jgi:hypothetical protein
MLMKSEYSQRVMLVSAVSDGALEGKSVSVIFTERYFARAIEQF